MPESVYRQRNTQDSPYYQCVEEHFEIFEQVYKERLEQQYGFYCPSVGQAKPTFNNVSPDFSGTNFIGLVRLRRINNYQTQHA